eukprot:Em0022g868a
MAAAISDVNGDPAASSALQHRKYVLAEFIDSEREYVKRLKMAYIDYMDHIQNSTSESISAQLKADVLPIFSSLPSIYNFHSSKLLTAMEECNGDPELLVKCFIDNERDFMIYIPYCKNKPLSDKTRAQHDKFFLQRQTELGQGWVFDDLLIAPVQRFNQYQLLLKDLLKDTKKAHLETARIEEALRLMTTIPKEANNIICLSMLVGMSRSQLLSHGTLWTQEALLFWDMRSPKEVKGEQRQVFLLDHRIIISLPSDNEGCFLFELGIKTLNGSLIETLEADKLRFGFSTAEREDFLFQAPSAESKKKWIHDIQAILNSQTNMMEALTRGGVKPGSLKVRQPSASLDWSDSDSSIDSDGDSTGPDSDGDWPKEVGFKKPVSRNRSRSSADQPNGFVPLSPGLPKKNNTISPGLKKGKTLDTPDFMSSSFSMENFKKLTSPSPSSPSSSPSTSVKRNHSFFSTTRKEVCTTMLTPFPMASSMHSMTLQVPHLVSMFSKSAIGRDMLFVGIDAQPPVAEKMHKVQPGEIFRLCETIRAEVWKVDILNGSDAGSTAIVQRDCLAEYSAPVSFAEISRLYKLKETIGKGYFSKVKEVKHKGTEKAHALKIFNKSYSTEDFYRELCIGYHLKHRNIVVYQGGVQGKDKAIVMELLVGRPIIDFLLYKPMVTEESVRSLISQLLDGVGYLHSHSILHLDIRVDNLFVQTTVQSDVLKILDLGAARHFNCVSNSPLTHRNEPPRSNQHLAPEVFRHEQYSPGTDIWAVGVVLYTLLYGCGPFQDIAHISSVNYVIPSEPSYTSEVRQLITSVFLSEVSQRPSASAAKACPWFKVGAKLDTCVNVSGLSQLKQLAKR